VGSCGINTQREIQTICSAEIGRSRGTQTKLSDALPERPRIQTRVQPRSEIGAQTNTTSSCRRGESRWCLAKYRRKSTNTRVCCSKESTNKYCLAEGEAHRWDGLSCHEGIDIAGKQQLMAVVRKGKSTPWAQTMPNEPQQTGFF
jgi:hypothetical protein